jgi:hypothetical protein
VTGGDSFIFVLFSVAPKNIDAMLSMAHRRRFPVYDVSIEMFDQDESDQPARSMGLGGYSGLVTPEQVRERKKTGQTFIS